MQSTLSPCDRLAYIISTDWGCDFNVRQLSPSIFDLAFTDLPLAVHGLCRKGRVASRKTPVYYQIYNTKLTESRVDPPQVCSRSPCDSDMTHYAKLVTQAMNCESFPPDIRIVNRRITLDFEGKYEFKSLKCPKTFVSHLIYFYK